MPETLYTLKINRRETPDEPNGIDVVVILPDGLEVEPDRFDIRFTMDFLTVHAAGPKPAEASDADTT